MFLHLVKPEQTKEAKLKEEKPKEDHTQTAKSASQAWGGEHTIQHTDEVLRTGTPETFIISLTNVTPIHSIEV